MLPIDAAHAPEEILHANPWVSLRRRGGFVYSHEDRCDGEIVAATAFLKSNPSIVLVRFEINPAHGDHMELCSMTGGVENHDPEDTALHEFWEEAGIASIDRLIPLGTLRPSKSADTTVFLYAAPVGDLPIGIPLHGDGDGSDLEVGAYCMMMSAKDALRQTQDPLLIALISRLEAVVS